MEESCRVCCAAPWLAVITAIAGLVAKVKIMIVREAPPSDADQDHDGGGVPPSKT
ncbi:MAG: hypothetical protein RLP98_14090 [Devosia sp.]